LAEAAKLAGMIIWLTALVLVALGAFAGYVQGAIRAVSSIVGLFVAALLASSLTAFFRPVVHLAGVQNPFLLTALSPIVAFAVVLIVVKIGGQTVHQKVEYFFKYKKDSRYPHWERMIKRVGLCVGVLGGAIYFFLVSLLVYVGGYLTTQLSAGEKDGFALGTLNSMRHQLVQTKFDRVVAAHDPAPADFYAASDVVGLVFHNPLLEGRIRRYPAFLSLAERDEFKALGTDSGFQNLLQSGASVQEIASYPKVKEMINNPALVDEMKRLVGENLSDLRGFLETGKSEKFKSEKILGRWSINIESTYNDYRRARPDLPPAQLTKIKQSLQKDLDSRIFVAAPDGNLAILKVEPETVGSNVQASELARGNWSNDNGAYEVSFVVNAKPERNKVSFENDDRIRFSFGGRSLVFDREM
jgi:hypothetical protein